MFLLVLVRLKVLLDFYIVLVYNKQVSNMKTNQILSVVVGLFSALSLNSCVVDVPVDGGHHGPIYQHVQGYPPGYRPQYGGQQQYYVTPPNNYGDAASSRVGGFPPLGGYDPNYRYGMGGYRH